MNQIADSASESLSSANMARLASKEMGNMAGELRALVAHFTLDEGNGRTRAVVSQRAA